MDWKNNFDLKLTLCKESFKRIEENVTSLLDNDSLIVSMTVLCLVCICNLHIYQM